MSGYVGLDQPPLGRRVGPEAPEPLEAEGKLWLPVSRPGRDTIGGGVIRAVPGERCQGAPSIGSLGLVFLRPSLGWRR